MVRCAAPQPCCDQVRVVLLCVPCKSSHTAGVLSISQSISQSVNQSVSQSVNQSVSQSVSQPSSQTVNQSVSPSANQSTSQPVNKSDSQKVRRQSANSVRAWCFAPSCVSANTPLRPVRHCVHVDPGEIVHRTWRILHIRLPADHSCLSRSGVAAIRPVACAHKTEKHSLNHKKC